MSTMADTLLSALGGSVLTMAGTLVWEGVKRRNARQNLCRAIVAECRYNLSILDEVVEGVVLYHGSFKRLSVEFFKTIRQQSTDYAVKVDLLRALSRVIVDLDLLNMEADFAFKGHGGDGRTGQNAVDISSTISGARIGVRNSLNSILKIASEELKEEGEE